MPDKEKPWAVEKLKTTAHMIRFTNVQDGWKQPILLTADRHHDNRHTNQKLELAHLKKARELNAPIIDIGDFFCAMQGKYDPRKSYTGLRPEHIGDNYFDLLLDEAEEFYGPYSDLFAIIGKGNHEANVLKRQQIDLTKGIARRLGAYPGVFSGWVFLRFLINKTRSITLKLKYHHGYGGGGPVTRGVIQTNRRAVYLPDADIIFTGHIHESWIVPIMRERVNGAGGTSIQPQWHISGPTYKEEYLSQDGYHIENGRPPKPTGAVWLWLEHKNGRIKVTPELDIN